MARPSETFWAVEKRLHAIATLDSSGVWAGVLKALAEQQDGESYMIDATIVRAHQDATGAKKGDPKPSDTAAEVQPQRFMLLWTPSEIPSDSR